MEHLFTPVIRKSNTSEVHDEPGKTKLVTSSEILKVNRFPSSLPTELGNRLDFLLLRETENEVIYKQIKSTLELKISKES